MNVEQEARDLLNAVWTDRGGASPWALCDQRHKHNVVEAVCRALEARNETQAKLEQSEKAFDDYRREVSDVLTGAWRYLHPGMCISLQQRDQLSRFIIPEPVDPLTAMLDDLGMTRADFDAALTKIGGKVVFEGKGA